MYSVTPHRLQSVAGYSAALQANVKGKECYGVLFVAKLIMNYEAC